MVALRPARRDCYGKRVAASLTELNMLIQACSSYTSLTWLKSLSLNTVISLRLPRTANLRSKIALRKPSKVLVKALALADGAIKGASAAEWGKQQLDKEEEIPT
jgi:hypothetical protein